jgi:hypothetical protein
MMPTTLLSSSLLNPGVMFLPSSPKIGVVVIDIRGLRTNGNSCIYNAYFAADFGDSLHEREHIRSIEVIQSSQAEHSVELTMLLDREVAYVVLGRTLNCRATGRVSQIAPFQYLPRALDSETRSFVARKFDGVKPLEARQVKDTQTLYGSAGQVKNALHNAS